MADSPGAEVWERVRARLEQVDRLLASTDALPIDKQKEVLRARARALAAESAVAAPATETLPVITFTLGKERYALDVEAVQEIRDLQDLTPVPCTPAFVVGVINLRGEVLSVIDLRKFLGLADHGITDLMKTIVISCDGLTVGILVQRILEMFDLPVADIAPAPTSISGEQARYIRGVTRDSLIVLDIHAIVSDERMIVDDSSPHGNAPQRS